MSSTTTYQSLLNELSTLLYDHSDTPRIDAEILLQHVVQRPLAWLIAYGDTIVTADHIKHSYALAQQRQSGLPVAYLIGQRDFWSLNLEVNDCVLIPRPDTETLVEQALDRIPADRPVRVLDLGTGSGAIALAIAKERPASQVLAVDRMSEALTVAKRNAERNRISNVEFRLSHWFDALASSERFDVIAANPPYVAPNDRHLQQGDLRFEPMSALVSDDNGLADLKHIIDGASAYLLPDGWLLVEHGFNQAEPVYDLFSCAGFEKIQCVQDINDLPRCTLAQHRH